METRGRRGAGEETDRGTEERPRGTETRPGVSGNERVANGDVQPATTSRKNVRSGESRSQKVSERERRGAAEISTEAGEKAEAELARGNEQVASESEIKRRIKNVQPTTNRKNVRGGESRSQRVSKESRTSSGPIPPGETKAKAGNEREAQDFQPRTADQKNVTRGKSGVQRLSEEERRGSSKVSTEAGAELKAKLQEEYDQDTVPKGARPDQPIDQRKRVAQQRLGEEMGRKGEEAQRAGAEPASGNEQVAQETKKRSK